MINGSSSFDGGIDYLELSLTNIALFTALDIRSSILSRGKVLVTDLDGKEIENDKFLDLISNPNPFQSQQDFIKQHFWFKGLGTNVVRSIKIRNNGSSKDIENVKYLNNLIPSCINWKDVNKVNKAVVSKRDYDALLEKEIEYKIGDKNYDVPVKDLEFFHDISNGMVNNSAFKSKSRIDALLPELKNIEEAQISKNINLQFSSKFIATNKSKEAGGYSKNLEEGEKKSIERAISSKGILATNAEIDLKSLANNLKQLSLDEAVNSSAMKVFSAYSINKDVLNWHTNGVSTYDNRSIGVLDWIQNSIQAEADDWSNTWTNRFNYREQGKKIQMSFNHLPIMKKVEIDRIDFVKKQSDIIKTLVDAGASFESAVKLLGIDELKKGKNE